MSSLTVTNDKRRLLQKEQEECQEPENQDPCMTEDFTVVELDDAIKLLKATKSPGPDQITNELIQNLGPRAKNRLLEIFQQQLEKWKDGPIQLLKKKIDYSKAENTSPSV